MGFKKVYRGFLSGIEKIPAKIEVIKYQCAERRAIRRKRPLYENVTWTQEQTQAFNEYWQTNYGKAIPSYWNKLYENCSGRFDIEYLPEIIYSTQIEPKWNDYSYVRVLEDKSLIDTFALGTGCVTPKTICLCSDGRYFDSARKPINKAEFIDILQSHSDVILKPTIGSSSGHGIHIIKERMSKDAADRLLSSMGKDFIVQELIKPHPIFASFNPTSINTIRIITYILNGRIYHMPICFRMGRAGKNVDNIHAGGIVIGVEDDGVLLAKAYELGYGDNNITYSAHPDSKISFADSQLPCIDKIIRSAYQLHGRFPHIGIISWDFTVDKDDQPVLIEANIRGQSIWFLQMVHGKGCFGENTKVVLRLLKK